jgi:sRNA-binding protein
MTRKELCNHIEDKFQWPRDTFWNLESTQKIRVCSQMARNIMTVAEKQFYENKANAERKEKSRVTPKSPRKKATTFKPKQNKTKTIKKSKATQNIPFGGKKK